MGIIKISKDTLYSIKVEKGNEREESLFKEAYIKAEKELNSIINQNTVVNKSNNSNGNNSINEFDINNIIAFVGQRGTGKTSTMVSFKEYLKSEFQYGDDSINFETLNTIDPSILNRNDSLIEIVIGELFKEFKKEMRSIDTIKKQDLVRCFESVYRDFKLLSQDRKLNCNDDNLEGLVNLSSAINLKKNISRLIDTYLVSTKENEKSYLIISIDDLDMNTSEGQSMLEDIRKYLMIPNVVILMAIKIEQLDEIVTQKNIKDTETYQKLFINSQENEIKEKFLVDTEDKTFRYLEKLIPFNRRIVLPKIQPGIDKIEFGDGFENMAKFCSNLESEECIISIKKIIYEAFNKKFKYEVVSENHWNLILPDTIRSYVVLFDFLNSVENPQDYNDYLHNIRLLKEYVKDNLINKAKGTFGRMFLYDLLECQTNEINKKAVVYINSYLYKILNIKDEIIADKSMTKKENAIYYDIEELFRRKRYILKSNINFGYLITWIRLAEIYMENEKETVELLKMIITIKYYELYYICKLKEIENNGDNQKESIIKFTGSDFVGRFFELGRNKHVNSKNNRLESESQKKRSSGDKIIFDKDNFDPLDKYKSDLGIVSEEKSSQFNIKLSKLCNYMLDNNNKDKKEIIYINKYLDLIFTLYEPSYQDQWKTRNSVLYRYEFSLADKWDTKYDLSKYNFKPCNIIGYKIFESNDKFDDRLLTIFNIDLYINILYKLNIKLNNSRPKKPSEMIEAILKYLDEVSKEYNKKLDFRLDKDEYILTFLKENIDEPKVFDSMDGYYPDKDSNKDSNTKDKIKSVDEEKDDKMDNE